jgi:hypothetical protein
MSASGPGAGAVRRVSSASTRVVRVWRDLPAERRLAALASLGLFVTLFLPWYQETVIASGVTSPRNYSASLTGWSAFSFVEAAVLLVAVGVLFLLFMRAEGNAFHIPGGDGGVITVAGFWACALIVWRIFDKQGITGQGRYSTTTAGIEWGIFIALGIAALLAYAGSRIRHAHEPEPPLPGEREARPRAEQRRTSRWWRRQGRAPAPRRASQRPPRPSRAPDMDADDTWTQEARAPRPEEPRMRPARAVQPPARPAGDEWPPPAQRPASDADTVVPPASEVDTIVPAASEADTVVRAASEEAETLVRPADGARAPAERQRARQPGPADPPRRRIRPRSVAAPAQQSPPADGAPAQPPPPSDAARTRPAPRLDRREIQDLDIAEPPTARLGRRKPRAPKADETDDQLTIRLDRLD